MRQALRLAESVKKYSRNIRSHIMNVRADQKVEDLRGEPFKIQEHRSTFFGAESAGACQSTTTPGTGIDRASSALKGLRIPPPFQGGQNGLGAIPGALPRADILRAVGAKPQG